RVMHRVTINGNRTGRAFETSTAQVTSSRVSPDTAYRYAKGVRKVVCVAAPGSCADGVLAVHRLGCQGALPSASPSLRHCGMPWHLFPGARDGAAVRPPKSRTSVAEAAFPAFCVPDESRR